MTLLLKAKLKIFLCLKHHTLKIYGGVKKQLHTFSTSAMAGAEMVCFTTTSLNLSTH